MIMRNDWEEAFIDASFWIALVNRRDDHHDDAVAQWRFVNENGLRRATTNWTLYEALTNLNSRQSNRHDLALRLLGIVRGPGIVVDDAAAYEQEALRIFAGRADKRWSVVDCASFACIRARRCPLALTYDARDFGQARGEFGFTILSL